MEKAEFYPRPLSVYLEKTGLVFQADPKTFKITTDDKAGIVVLSFLTDPLRNVKVSDSKGDTSFIPLSKVSKKVEDEIDNAYVHESRNVIPGDVFKAKLIEMGINV